ncbi:sensor histidine kinase [Paenibacillus sp. N3.4]|uniref:sensor histidine kinase n=1 Tax=Paenibacillus sp. N3.4 TaxID=2603222 RepID=UPI0011CB6F34|nr:sensor histidine kinase [Paenibacillus sp. N3.4]TXK79611.1 HAMP domain-containing protein [Paenibacillus sp. N3.4]
MKMPSFSWRQKLITISLLCLFFPSVITLALTGLYTKNELTNKASFKSEQSLEVADLYISNIVIDMLNAFNTLQYDSEFITNLRVAWNSYDKNGGKQVDFFAYKPVSEKLEQLTFFGGQTYVSVLLPNGLYFSNYSTYQNDLSYMYEEPWLTRMSADPVNMTNWIGAQNNYVRSDAKKYPKLITVVRSFRLYANMQNAYIMISKPEGQFHEIFSKYAEDQTMMLLDGQGTILSQSNVDKIGTKVPKDILTAGLTEKTNWNGQEYISVNHPLSFAGWSLQCLTPYREVTGKIGNFLNDIIVFQALFFVVFAVVLFYLLRQLTVPIVQLVKTAMRVESGNLNERSMIVGKDEIGRLGSSFDRMLDRIEEMIQQIEWEQGRKRMAELEALQAQINPHFLFNTLNSIRLQVRMKGEMEISEIIGSLSTLLRMTINRNNEFLTLHEEVATIEQYMKLMNFRHLENVQLTTSLASDTLLAMIPRFTLQPLIENAYLHGLRQRHGQISVNSWKQGHLLFISVEDDGVGMTEEELTSVRAMLLESNRPGEPVKGKSSRMNGIGLRNVNERLRMIYGEAYHVELMSAPGLGLKLTLHLPITFHMEEEEDAKDV